MAAEEQKTGTLQGLRRQLRLDGAVWLVIMLALGLGLAAFFALSGIEDVSRQSDLLTIVFGLGALVLLVLAIVVGTASRVVQFTASHAIVALLGGFGFDWALGFGCGAGLAFLVGD